MRYGAQTRREKKGLETQTILSGWNVDFRYWCMMAKNREFGEVEARDHS
jgi:hypothetical protein